VRQPAAARAATGPTRVAAPGQPGAITTGAVEQRGHELRVESPEAVSHRFHVVLTVERTSR